MPDYRTYSQNEFPSVFKWQALAFMRTEWPYIFEGDDKFLTETYEPELNPIHFVMAQGDMLISYAAIVRTTLTHAGHTYQVYGFGNMLTFPPHRREGHGQKLEPFYAAAGWAITGAPTRFGHPSNYEDGEEKRMMIFVSEKEQQNRADFENLPVYVDWTW